MRIPRPPGWETRPSIIRFRRLWHQAGLPCLFCRIEGGRWRP